MSWNLRCPWCDYYIIVGNRGMHGSDMGAGVEAANLMEEHVIEVHNKTWVEFIKETS